MTALSEVNTHDPARCAGENCVVHNPSDHHMNTWPVNIRLDRRYALAERICPHGVGHPDPDSLAYIEMEVGPSAAVDAIHGCDGCCRETDS